MISKNSRMKTLFVQAAAHNVEVPSDPNTPYVFSSDLIGPDGQVLGQETIESGLTKGQVALWKHPVLDPERARRILSVLEEEKRRREEALASQAQTFEETMPAFLAARQAVDTTGAAPTRQSQTKPDSSPELPRSPLQNIGIRLGAFLFGLFWRDGMVRARLPQEAQIAAQNFRQTQFPVEPPVPKRSSPPMVLIAPDRLDDDVHKALQDGGGW